MWGGKSRKESMDQVSYTELAKASLMVLVLGYSKAFSVPRLLVSAWGSPPYPPWGLQVVDFTFTNPRPDPW